MRSSCSCNLTNNMYVKMVSANFFITILLCCVTYVLSTKQLNCHLHEDDSYDGDIGVSYDREELSIYKYNNTKFVNFLLRDVKVKFDGVFTKVKEATAHVVGIQTDVEGIAKLQKNGKEYTLTSCHLDLRKNAKVVDNIHLSIQVRIIELAHACIKDKLCQSLGSAQQDDYIRAKIDHYDFGENSIMFDVLAEKYPNLNLPSSTEYNLQHTINLLADFGLASLITQLSKNQLGQIQLPDVNETIPGIPMINQGYFRLNDGTFGNLRGFIRSKDVLINHKGLEFTIQGEIKLPEAHIHFDKYALKYGLLGTNGKIDIKINGVVFYIKVTVNYNKSPCEIAVPAMQSKIGNFTFKLSDNGVIDSVINELTTNIVNRHIPNIISLVEAKIKEAIKEPLEKFNCETFRP